MNNKQRIKDKFVRRCSYFVTPLADWFYVVSGNREINRLGVYIREYQHNYIEGMESLSDKAAKSLSYGIKKRKRKDTIFYFMVPLPGCIVCGPQPFPMHAFRDISFLRPSRRGKGRIYLPTNRDSVGQSNISK